MEYSESASGKDLLKMLSAGTDRLQLYASNVDFLNVFPVPDGDTGNNMLFTMRAALEEAQSVSQDSASAVAEAFARGALVGARGNSGIILSQFWQGLAQSINGKKHIDTADLAASMQKAAVLAFKALSKPVEGTILTVINDIAEATRHVSIRRENLVSFMKQVVDAARESVARTPQQLPVLREAGVVDAGGWGLQIILQGILDSLRSGRKDPSQERSSSTEMKKGNLPRKQISEWLPYGYCTEFLLRGNDLDPDNIRAALEDRGESLVVAGSGSMIRVHLHTEDPDAVIQYARSLGRVDRLSIRNMDEQHESFLHDREVAMSAALAEEAAVVLALVPSEGLAAVFSSLGAEPVVVDEQDASRGIEVLRTIVEVRLDCAVIILPNSRQLFSAAKAHFGSLARRVSIVPSKTIPQGIAAVLAHNPGEDSETNQKLMKKAIEQVRSIEICDASHHPVSELVSPVDAPSYVGLLEGDPVASGGDAWTVLLEVLGRLETESAELITVYYSENAAGEAVEEMDFNLHSSHPNLKVETVPAGRLRSDFIISLE
jgi:DAK2 domain fusion protein YloV